MTDPDPDQVHSRRYIAIATDTFGEKRAYPDLPGVADEREIVTEWLTDERLGERQFIQEHSELASNPKLKDIEHHLRRPDPPWHRADAAVIYITGHGVISKGEDRKHYVVLEETLSGDLPSTALSTADLLGWFANKDLEHLLVIIDVCFAGQVAEELGSRARRHWLILPSALKDQQAQQRVLARAIQRYIKDAGKLNTSYPYLQVRQFVNALNAQLPRAQRVEPIYKGKSNDRHMGLPNPSYDPRFGLVRAEPARQDMALLASVLPIHNRVGGQAPSEGRPGWLFTSRRRLMREMITAVKALGVTMITGSAGSGKSMALSRLATLSDPEFRDHHVAEVVGVPDDMLPSLGAVTVAVSAKGLSALEISDQICNHLGAPGRANAGSDPVQANLDALNDLLAESKGRLTIVLDALDEAIRASEVVTSFLRPLWRGHSSRICLLVGVRSRGGNDADGQADDAKGGALAALVTEELRARHIRADDDDHEPEGPDPDLLQFVVNVLINTPGSSYQDAPTEEVDQVAGIITGFAGRSYLMASVAASSAAGRRPRMSPDDQAWQAELSRGLFGVFQGDLHQSFTDPVERRRGVALLRAVAFARGTGLPWDRVWPAVATAVDSVETGGRRYGDGDVEWLLGSRLSAYLVAGIEDDLTVYRLLHDELREILRNRWRELLQPPESSAQAGAPPGAPAISARVDDAETIRVERRIALELRVEANVESTSSVDAPVPPYIRRHFAEHALAGGDPDLPVPFLPYLDIVRLATAFGGLPGRRQLEESVPGLPVVRRVTYLWEWERPARNAAAIEMWAALGEVALPRSVGGPWQVLWAAQPQDVSTVLGRQRGIVRAVAVADLPKGPVVVAGGSGGLLYTWDLGANGRYGDRAPVDTGGKSIVAIAIAQLPDQVAIAVTGSEDGKIRLWDVAAGHALGAPLDGGRGAITAVATARLPGGQVVIIASDGAGTIRTWDLASREPVGMPLPCGDGMALGITTVRVDGKVLGLATGEDSGLQIWDVATGAADGPRLTHPLAGSTWTNTLQGSRVIAAEVLGGTETAITGDGDGLLLWDLRKREPIRRRLIGGDKKIRSLATTRLGDQVLGLVGASSAVQVIDLETGEPVGDLMRGHGGSVEAASVAALPDGSVLAVSGSRDESVRTWEVPAAALAASRVSRHIESRVEDVATVRLPDGRTIVLTCINCAVRVWELEHGAELAPLTGHESPVTCVAVASCEDGVVAAAGHWDGTIDTWRVADGTPTRRSRLGGKGTAATSLTMAKLPGERLVAIVARRSGSVQACDPLEGTWVGEPLGGHAKGLVRVATSVTPDGRVLAISGGEDGQVRIRDLGAHLGPDGPAPDLAVVDIGQPVTSLTADVMSDEQPCVIVGGADGTVRLLDLLAGTPIGDPWEACSGAVTAVVPGHLPGGRGAIFTGGADALVQAWDPSTSQPIGEALPVAGPIRAMAFYSEAASLVVGGQGVAVTRPRHAAQAD